MPMENFVDEFNRWMQAVQCELQEKSMRSTIIISAATLDTQLEKLIKNILLQEKNTDDDIFEGGNAPLSTFSSKITLAYYLGLISEHERKTLDCIRKIRNKAAHEIDILSGRVSDSINNMCLNLEIPQGMYIPIELFCGNPSDSDKTYNPNNEKNPQKRFVNAFYYMTQYLFFHNLEYIDFKVEKYQAPKPFEFMEMFKNILENDNERILLYLKRCKEKAQKDLCELQTFARDYVSGDVIAYRQEKLDSKEKILEAIGIVADELKAFELEISLRENKNVLNVSDSNYSQTCYSIQLLERLIEVMKEYQ